MNAVLALERVVREYRTAARTQRVLDGVSLVLEPAELLAITGPSGSGKSTLLNLCALLDRPDEGEVFLCGQRTSALDETTTTRLRGRRVGMVFQSYALLPHRSVLENVVFRFRYLDLTDADGGRRRARATLEALGLGELAEHPARLLSGGEMQRVAIARAVVMPPQVLVADEPTGNLDAESAAAVMRCFCELRREQGISVILATHDHSLLPYCTRHLHCHDGRLLPAA